MTDKELLEVNERAIEAAAEKALYEFTAGGTPYEEEHFRQGFKAGWKGALKAELALAVTQHVEAKDE